MHRRYGRDMRWLFSGICVVQLVACTPGSFASNSNATNVAGSSVARTLVIDVDLTNDPANTTPGGIGAGYAPIVATIAIGDAVRFHNSDGFPHTATSIAGTAFPSAYPFDGSALSAAGTTLSGGFSSGSLAPGTTSQAFVADRSGTMLYGCFYHYGSPMRAAIVVR